ncbi:hypothetical protein E2C01_090985 [Portunus trituberculatus]|uniref:Uncharacterized protein n=1 Tax=Portunus trituberculatus TaxID=210409 RepID=A0A5B7JLU5_PORTR|nr:hypothetical protein [Portunus trituberculatus]
MLRWDGREEASLHLSRRKGRQAGKQAGRRGAMWGSGLRVHEAVGGSPVRLCAPRRWAPVRRWP